MFNKTVKSGGDAPVAEPPARSSLSAPRSNAVPSIISADLVIEGNLKSSGEIQIDGRVIGDIESRSVTVGQTAEVLAYRFGITREQADAYALESHKRLAKAQEDGTLEGEVETVFDRDGEFYTKDDGVRPESSMEKLAKLDPVFEKPYGKVTPGNSSQITDGASWLILASEEAVEEHGLEPKARIIDSEWSALDPSIMGLGPVLCSTAITKRQQLSRTDIDLWELNEAFAAQVLACLAAWKDADFCRELLGLDEAFGEIEHDRLNVDGGAISLGHPVGTSGNRIVLHLMNAMRKAGHKRGIATECIGGGQGGAMLIETV